MAIKVELSSVIYPLLAVLEQISCKTEKYAYYSTYSHKS